MATQGIVAWAPIGAHIELRCKYHPSLRWNTKNIAPIGARTVFYRGHENKGYDVDECNCAVTALTPVVPSEWSVVSLQAIAEHRALLASPPSEPPTERLPWGRFLVQQWAWQLGYDVSQSRSIALGRWDAELLPMPAVPGSAWSEAALNAMRKQIADMRDPEAYTLDWDHFLVLAWATACGYEKQTATAIALDRVRNHLPPMPEVPQDIREAAEAACWSSGEYE
jgi:hypothetical protein